MKLPALSSRIGCARQRQSSRQSSNATRLRGLRQICASQPTPSSSFAFSDLRFFVASFVEQKAGRDTCLTAQQNSLDIDSIARHPAPEAKFQVSGATGRADAWPDQTGVKLPAAARTCDRLRQWPLFRSLRAYRRQRRGLPRDPGPPVSPTSHRNLRCAPISSALRHFRLFSATGLTAQQNSLDTPQTRSQG